MPTSAVAFFSTHRVGPKFYQQSSLMPPNKSRQYDGQKALQTFGFGLQDTRKFNMVTSVIDKHNHAFGPLILAAVCMGIMYFSVNTFQPF